MPTDTKKIAPNRFFTGSTNRIILSASMVSAKMLPMTNAPKALLNPTFVEITAIKQHNPNATMSNVSLFINFLHFRKNIGTRKIPTTNHRIRKKPIMMKLDNI